MKIKKIPDWIVSCKILPPTFSIALSPHVYLSKKLYEDYKTGKPNYSTEAMIAHEATHVDRQETIGLWRWIFLYIFSKKFCLREELIASTEEMAIYKQYGKIFNIGRRATTLSTFWLYHHCVSYAEAKKKLEEIWGNI